MNNVQTPITPTKSSKPKYIPIETIRELITVRGLSIPEAAKILGIARVSLWERCKRHQIMSKDQLAMYRSQRADVITSKGAALLNSLTIDAIKAIPPSQRAVAFGILYDKERLERGESTANIAIGHVTRELKEIDSERRKLESELADLAGDNDA